MLDRILLLRQHGLGQYLEEKYKTYTKTRCVLDDQVLRTNKYNGPLTLYQMKGALYIVLVGYSLATLSFVCEVLSFRRTQRMKKIKKSFKTEK